MKVNQVAVAGDADGEAVRACLNAAINAYNANQTSNLGLTARQKITLGNKQKSLFLPLSQVFGFYKDITVFRDVKHTLLFDRAMPNNYIMKTRAVNAGKFNIVHISLWMPKVTPSLEIQTDLEAKLVSGHIKDLYFEQVLDY